MAKKTKNQESTMSTKEMLAKRNDLVKELLKARLSLDPATVTTEGGLAGVRKELKGLSRKLGAQSVNRGKK